MYTKQKVISGILLIFGILVLINFFSNRFFLRLDFTEDNQFTLSDATKSILKSLDEPVTVSAYFSEDLPPDITKVKKDFRDLLVEYDNASGGKVVYQFINPGKDQETEMEAQQAGVQPIMINVREKDQMKQQKAYLGAVLQLGDKKETIPFIQPGSAMEYDLSTNIKKLSLKEKVKIALLQGNGEPALSELPQLYQQLSILYDVSTAKLTDSTDIGSDIKTLIIIAPSDTVKPELFSKLDNYISKGGRVLVALNRVKGDFSTASGSSVKTGFEDWLNKKGIDVQDEFVIDANSSNVMVRQQSGMFIMNTPVRFPYLPIITKFADHPITKGIESVMLPFASPIKTTKKDSSEIITNLAVTSDKAGFERPPVYFDVSRQWGAADFPASSLPVAVAVENTVNGITSKMVVFGDGDFAVNGSGQNSQRIQEDNISLMSNAIDWLSDDTGLISLRTKGVTSRPIDPNLEEGTKTFLKYFNFLLPIFLIIGFGIVRYQFRRRLRNKWMNEEYV
ncbi:MAG TPA: GldG family protein [Ignavibacteriaceae bacterium]|nr:GldG family protein [Ignavibacteriaceae bacterium]